MLSYHVTNSINSWMQEGVAQFKDGSVFTGFYDGYGRLDGEDMPIFSDDDNDYDPIYPQVHHKACWDVAGRPEYEGPSNSSNDQGFFFTDPEHDIPEPVVATGEMR